MNDQKKELNERSSLMVASTTERQREELDVEQNEEKLTPKLLLIKIVVIFGVAISWACATQFTKSALNVDKNHFYAPYSLVWFNTCFMSICYPVFLIYAKAAEHKTIKESNDHALLLFSKSGRLTALHLIKRVLPFNILWVLANYAFSQSLGRISAAAASSIMSTNTAMVCVLSAVLIHESLTIEKILAVLFAIGGVTVISLDNEFAGDWLGITLVIFSAATAAIYKVFFKKINGHATLGQVSLFMTLLGLLNLFINIVPSAILVVFKIDHIEWWAVPWLPLAGSALLGLVYNFLVNFGIALLSPLVISIGMLCGIPINAAIDIVFRDMPATVKFLVGAILIIISFILCAIPLREITKSQLRKRRNSNNDA